MRHARIAHLEGRATYFRARKLRSLSCLLGLVALAWLAGCATRRSLSRTTPLALAQAAHAQWIARPDDARASRNFYRSVARLLEWFDALPVARRIQTCRDAGLAVEMDPVEESGLYRFTIADKVPAHRLLRRHIRSGIGVPVVAWRPNDGSDQWDAFRPPRELPHRLPPCSSAKGTVGGRYVCCHRIAAIQSRWKGARIRWPRISARRLPRSPGRPNRCAEADFAACSIPPPSRAVRNSI